jgi:GntR family transcriptional regulator
MVRFRLDRLSPIPFYRQVGDLVLAGLGSGQISPGEKLPTIRELAVTLEVNPNTIVRAYAELQAMGVLDTQQGSGVFVKLQRARPVSKIERQRMIAALCADFVGRAQLLNITIEELIGHLEQMRRS